MEVRRRNNDKVKSDEKKRFKESTEKVRRNGTKQECKPVEELMEGNVGVL